MAAGGTFTVQNKVRPGVYFRFRSKNKQDLTVGDRGIAALCEPLHWGPTAKVIEIDAGADMTVYTGYDITAPENRFLTEIFKGTNRTAAPRKVLLYRPTASGAVKATMEIAPLTATAKYVGVRGNDISVVVTALSSPEGSFEVSTVVDGEIKDQQTAKTVEELAANSWVDWSGTGALTANVGTALTGGEDGVVAASAYSAFLTAIEPYKFDVLIYDGADNTARTAMESFIKRVNTETGRYSQLVESGSTNPDTRYIVNVDSGAVLDDGTTLTPQQVCWWAGGALAAATYGEDLTNAVYPNAVDISPRLTHSQYVDAINSGKFVLNADDGTVRVEYDINSLVTYTSEIGEVYRYNRTMRLCNTIANDLYSQFSKNYVGIVDNTDAGRMEYKSAVVKYLTQLQASGGIQNFDGETDVTVEKGDAKDAVLITLAMEGALKLKEISYIHAEGYPAAEMKHGAIALIDNEMPTVAIATPDNTYEKTASNIEEIRARGGKIIAVIARDDTHVRRSADYTIEVPVVTDCLMPIVVSVPLQLLAYYIAVNKGRNVDQPRNLAKSVTVE